MLDCHPSQTSNCLRKLSKFSRSRDFSREFSDMCQKHQELRMLRRKVHSHFIFSIWGEQRRPSTDKIWRPCGPHENLLLSLKCAVSSGPRPCSVWKWCHDCRLSTETTNITGYLKTAQLCLFPTREFIESLQRFLHFKWRWSSQQRLKLQEQCAQSGSCFCELQHENINLEKFGGTFGFLDPFILLRVKKTIYVLTRS